MSKVKVGFTIAAATTVLTGAVLGFNGSIISAFEAPLVAATGPVVGQTSSPVGPVVGVTNSPVTPSTPYTPSTGTVTNPTTSTTLEQANTVSVKPDSAAVVGTKDGSVEIKLPAGVFGTASKDVTVGLAKVESLAVPKPAAFEVAGPIIEIKAGNEKHVNLEKPATVTVKIDKAKTAGVDPQRIAVFYEDETSGEWLYQGAVIDSTNGTVSFEITHFSRYAVFMNNTQFSDTASVAWAKDSINTAIGAKVIDGFEDGSFRPNAEVTRAQFVQMLVRALGLSSSEKAALSFSDVKQSDWYYTSVAVAKKANLVDGVSETSFAPSATVTREQVATFLTRAFELKKVNGTALSTFKDLASVSSWAKTSLDAVIEAGVLNGYEDQTARPHANVTRAQAVELLVNALENTGKAGVK